MQAVSNTSPLNYLVLIGLDHVLPALFEPMLAPPAVLEELSHPAAHQQVRAWAASPPSWLQVAAPPTLPDLGLGRGETQAICLAQHVQADVVLIDERRAAAVARSLGLFSTGTLGVLRIAADRKLIDLRAAIQALTTTSFRMTGELVRDLLADEGPYCD